MKKLFLLALAATSLYSQTLKPSVPAHIEFTLSNTDPAGPCSNPTIFYFNFVNSAMWGCQISPNTFMGAWVQQNPSVGGGVNSVNGQTGTVTITIPTDNGDLTNGRNFATVAQVPGLSAVLSVNGNTGNVTVPVPTLVSQLTNDSAFISAANAPVLSVNGLTGAVTLPSANYNQTVLVNGVPVTQRAKTNYAAGANTTLTPSDNGTDTTTLTITTTGGSGGGLPDPGANGLVKRSALNTTVAAVNGTDFYGPGFVIHDADLPNTITSDISGNSATATALKTAPSGCAGGQFISQIGANGVPISCGSAGTGGPTVSTGIADPLGSNCTSASVGAMYIQTSLSSSATGATQGLYGCSSFAGTYRWQAYHNGVVNVLSFGATANGTTDDSGAFQNAVNFAKNAQLYSGNYWGGTVFVPAGRYKLNSHIVLPRCTVGNGGLNYGSGNGIVSLIGESMNATVLDFSGDTTDFEGIAWDTTAVTRTAQQVIKNFTIEVPTKAGSYGIHYQYSSTNQSKCHNPGTISDGAVGCYTERQENLDIENINFEGNSATAKASLYLEGDCIACTFKNFTQRSTGVSSTYNTVLLLMDQCYLSSAENTEACGLNLSVVENMSAGTTGGGGAAVFVGRMSDTVFNTAFCDGSYGASATPYCYAFYNSDSNTLNGLFTEGGGGTFFYFNNAHLNNMKNWGMGTPITTWNAVAAFPQFGLVLVNSSQNTFDKEAADSFLSGAWQQKLGTAAATSAYIINQGSGYTSAPTCTITGGGTCIAKIDSGVVNFVYVNSPGAGTSIAFSGGGGTGATANVDQAFKIYIDPSSHNNQFTDLQITGAFATEIGYTSADLTNYFHWCDATNVAAAKCRVGPMGKVGTSPW